ncbi:ANTAR domain-containing response regulator [Arenicella xantha]|uniref:Response regulator receiver and ANTAR domain protein n=1 Tax=Arenicella xantha TaxID=644221 RepID=A0A395JPN3_9GAMM|nr:ANTAR domain-containing protein [Arenicella xantha]RBP53457.1 response regulator receiver and ANTAR domain protein [Arenicella xantha]
MNAKHHSIHSQVTANAVRMYTHRILLIENVKQFSSSDFLAEKLRDQNFEALEVSESAKQLLDKVKVMTPDVLILSVESLDPETLQQLVEINDIAPLPVIVFARRHAPELVQKVIEAGVSSYVVDDVRAHRLPVIIDLAVFRFNQMQSLCTELNETKARLSDRKLIERAKGILMEQKQLTENEAYTQMRRSAMDHGQTMVELSKRIIEVTEILA